MTTFIKLIVFLLGMCLSVQVLAALYGIIDLWYTIHTAYPKVIRRILVWGGISAGIAILLEESWRGTFLWGMIVYVPFYLTNFIVIQFLVKYKSRSKERTTIR